MANGEWQIANGIIERRTCLIDMALNNRKLNDGIGWNMQTDG